MRRQETGRGEWSVLDPIRGYRICRYNHRYHDGTHVHQPENAPPLGAVDLDTPKEAEAVMRRYHEENEPFDLAGLREVIKQWKSESVDA